MPSDFCQSIPSLQRSRRKKSKILRQRQKLKNSEYSSRSCNTSYSDNEETALIPEPKLSATACIQTSPRIFYCVGDQPPIYHQTTHVSSTTNFHTSEGSEIPEKISSVAVLHTESTQPFKLRAGNVSSPKDSDRSGNKGNKSEMDNTGAYGGAKAGAAFDPISFVQRPHVILRAVNWVSGFLDKAEL